jgi:uncharacterized membrane protein
MMSREAIVAAAAIWLVAACAAAAQDSGRPDPAVRWAVVGDAALTVREQPDPGAAAIGTLAAGASDVIVSGTTVEIDGPAWWQVVLPGIGRGWVEAAGLAGTDAEPESGYPIACVGTEPFWSIDLRDGEAVFTDMSADAAGRFIAGPVVGVVGRHGFAIASLTGPAGTGFMAAIPEPEGCSDGMSDLLFPLRGVVRVPGGEAAFDGCCGRAG